MFFLNFIFHKQIKRSKLGVFLVSFLFVLDLRVKKVAALGVPVNHDRVQNRTGCKVYTVPKKKSNMAKWELDPFLK